MDLSVHVSVRNLAGQCLLNHVTVVVFTQAMLEDVSESSMDSVIFQDDMADGSLSPLYTTQHSGIVVVNDGTLVFGEAERSGSGRTNPSPTQPGKGTCLCSMFSFLFVCLRCFYCCVFIVCYFCYLYEC